MSQITTKNRANELLAQMGPNMYREAYKKGMSLSAYLELYEDPSAEYKDGLDAFSRVLAAADLRTRSVDSLGLYASPYEDFCATEQTRALLPEIYSRIFRSVRTGKPAHTHHLTRDLYASADAAVGSWQRPYADAPAPRWDQQIQPTIPLSELVAVTTPIDGDSYRSFYLEHSDSATSMRRVAESAEVPSAKLKGHQHVVSLHKYGRRLEATYEQLRRQRFDVITLHLQQMAIQAEIDKLDDVIDVLVNGDGNSNAATNYALTTIDSAASAGTLTAKGWLGFKMKFDGAYMMTVALAQEAVVLAMYMLQMGGSNVPLITVPGSFGGLTPINRGLADGVRVGHTASAPSLKIVGIDTRFALQQLVEIGSNITEVERFTTRQTQDITITETVGFAIMDDKAVRTLNVNG